MSRSSTERLAWRPTGSRQVVAHDHGDHGHVDSRLLVDWHHHADGTFRWSIASPKATTGGCSVLGISNPPVGHLPIAARSCRSGDVLPVEGRLVSPSSQVPDRRLPLRLQRSGPGITAVLVLRHAENQRSPDSPSIHLSRVLLTMVPGCCLRSSPRSGRSPLGHRHAWDATAPALGQVGTPLGRRLVMEAVAFLARREWSDHPPVRAEMVGTFLRSWNDVLPDDQRQAAPVHPRLVGSAGTLSRRDGGRGWRSTGWCESRLRRGSDSPG